jgi:hypothetical protein
VCGVQDNDVVGHTYKERGTTGTFEVDRVLCTKHGWQGMDYWDEFVRKTHDQRVQERVYKTK